MQSASSVQRDKNARSSVVLPQPDDPSISVEDAYGSPPPIISSRTAIPRGTQPTRAGASSSNRRFDIASRRSSVRLACRPERHPVMDRTPHVLLVL